MTVFGRSSCLHGLLNEIDDDRSGELDSHELTEMVQLFVDMKKASADGCIALSTLPKEIQPTLQAFDVDGDGSVAPVELARAAELYKKSKQQAKNLGKIVAGLSFVLIVLVSPPTVCHYAAPDRPLLMPQVFAIVGMTAQVIEMAKETTTGSDGITTVAGSDQPAANAQIQQQDSLSDAFAWEPAQLDAVKSLYFPEDETVSCAADTYCEGGTELSYTVTGWARNAEAGLTFFTARGDTVNVNAAGDMQVTEEDGDVILAISAAEDTGRRRLGFFSALMTSGSFMMMQAGAF